MIFNEHKIILDLCGGTGSWSKPYKENGYDVRVIDPQEWLEDDFGTGDVRLFKKPNEEIYGILAAPPCTHSQLVVLDIGRKREQSLCLKACLLLMLV